MEPPSIINSLTKVAKIATKLVNIVKEVEAKQIAIDLQGYILSLQNDLLSMQSEQNNLLQIKNDLEKKLIEYENWDKIKSQYELKEITSGFFVYSPKQDSNLADPNHWLCTECFNNNKKSILQRKRSAYFCPKCKTE